MSGYIKLYRDIQKHWLWGKRRKYSQIEAWVDMLFMAYDTDSKFTLGIDIIQIERGSFVTSEIKLMERWRWSKTKVRMFLMLLENDSMITRLPDNKKTIITIVNTDVYQDTETTQASDVRPISAGEKPFQKPKPDSGYTPEFEVWYKSWPRSSAKKDSFKNFEKRRKEHGLDFILLCSQNYLDYFYSLPQKDQGYPYQSNNFFGDKAYYLDYATPKVPNSQQPQPQRPTQPVKQNSQMNIFSIYNQGGDE